MFAHAYQAGLIFRGSPQRRKTTFINIYIYVICIYFEAILSLKSFFYSTLWVLFRADVLRYVNKFKNVQSLYFSIFFPYFFFFFFFFFFFCYLLRSSCFLRRSMVFVVVFFLCFLQFWWSLFAWLVGALVLLMLLRCCYLQPDCSSILRGAYFCCTPSIQDVQTRPWLQTCCNPVKIAKRRQGNTLHVCTDPPPPPSQKKNSDRLVWKIHACWLSQWSKHGNWDQLSP